MLVITSFADLIKYLETRKKMAERQKGSQRFPNPHANGMVYAFEESLRAVQSLNTYLEANESEETPLEPTRVDETNSENSASS